MCVVLMKYVNAIFTNIENNILINITSNNYVMNWTILIVKNENNSPTKSFVKTVYLITYIYKERISRLVNDEQLTTMSIMKSNLNSDGQQFHQYQQNEQLALTSNNLTQKKRKQQQHSKCWCKLTINNNMLSILFLTV